MIWVEKLSKPYLRLSYDKVRGMERRTGHLTQIFENAIDRVGRLARTHGGMEDDVECKFAKLRES